MYLCLMLVKITAIGKTDDLKLQQLIQVYTNRIKRYVKFELQIIPDLKNRSKLSFQEQKRKEGELLLKQFKNSDYVVLLDENGKQYSSVEFANYLQQRMNSGAKCLCFVIGGPYGFSEEVYKRAQGKLSLSKMTFSHQMVRLFFCEQVYRGFSILNNEPYHHQ